MNKNIVTEEAYHSFHGISWHVVSQSWAVSITCFGKQRRIGYLKFKEDGRTSATAEDAARMFDAALFALEAFTSPRTNPNFPLEYEAQTRAGIYQKWPDIEKREKELLEECEARGEDVNNLLSDRLAKQCGLEANDKANKNRKLLGRATRLLQMKNKVETLRIWYCQEDVSEVLSPERHAEFVKLDAEMRAHLLSASATLKQLAEIFTNSCNE